MQCKAVYIKNHSTNYFSLQMTSSKSLLHQFSALKYSNSEVTPNKALLSWEFKENSGMYVKVCLKWPVDERDIRLKSTSRNIYLQKLCLYIANGWTHSEYNFVFLFRQRSHITVQITKKKL